MFPKLLIESVTFLSSRATMFDKHYLLVQPWLQISARPLVYLPFRNDSSISSSLTFGLGGIAFLYRLAVVPKRFGDGEMSRRSSSLMARNLSIVMSIVMTEVPWQDSVDP